MRPARPPDIRATAATPDAARTSCRDARAGSDRAPRPSARRASRTRPACRRASRTAAAAAGRTRPALLRCSLGPPGARAFLVVDRDRAAALAGPLQHRLAVVRQAHRDPLDALDVQDALGRLAPGAGHAAYHHHAQPAARDGVFHTDVSKAHVVSGAEWEAARSIVIVQASPLGWAEPVQKKQFRCAFRRKRATAGSIRQCLGQLRHIRRRQFRVEFDDACAATFNPLGFRNRPVSNDSHRPGCTGAKCAA